MLDIPYDDGTAAAENSAMERRKIKKATMNSSKRNMLAWNYYVYEQRMYSKKIVSVCRLARSLHVSNFELTTFVTICRTPMDSNTKEHRNAANLRLINRSNESTRMKKKRFEQCYGNRSCLSLISKSNQIWINMTPIRRVYLQLLANRMKTAATAEELERSQHISLTFVSSSLKLNRQIDQMLLSYSRNKRAKTTYICTLVCAQR